MLGEIKIKNLRLRTFIGFNEEEKIHKQDIVINIRIVYDTNETEITDCPDGLNYKTHVIKKQIIQFLIEQYTFEPGVRKLKELFFDVIGELNLEILSGK